MAERARSPPPSTWGARLQSQGAEDQGCPPRGRQSASSTDHDPGGTRHVSSFTKYMEGPLTQHLCNEGAATAGGPTHCGGIHTCGQGCGPEAESQQVTAKVTVGPVTH